MGADSYLDRLRGAAKTLVWELPAGASVSLKGGIKSWLAHDIADAVDEIDNLHEAGDALAGSVRALIGSHPATDKVAKERLAAWATLKEAR